MGQGFFDLYTQYAEEFTDAPSIIHRRVALSLLSICLNRNVHLAQGARNLYPNLWMVIVAPSSFYRKSSSLWIGEDILKRIPDHQLLLAKEYSYEKFVEEMSHNSVGVFIANEFKTFMSVLGREYNAGMQSLLTDLYDCGDDYTRKTRGGGEIAIKEPFVNILSASTMDWLVSSVKDEDMAGGFLPRFLIVHAKEKGKSMPFQPPCDPVKRKELIQILTMACKIRGACHYSEAAKKAYSEWYYDFEDKCSRKKKVMSAFYARLTDYAKKFSILVHVERRLSETQDDWTSESFLGSPGTIELSERSAITPADVSRACAMADSFADEISSIVEDDIVFDRRDIMKKKVEKAIKGGHLEGVGRSELLRDTHLMAKDLTSIIDTLTQGRQVRSETVKVVSKDGNQEYQEMRYFWMEN